MLAASWEISVFLASSCWRRLINSASLSPRERPIMASLSAISCLYFERRKLRWLFCWWRSPQSCLSLLIYSVLSPSSSSICLSLSWRARKSSWFFLIITSLLSSTIFNFCSKLLVSCWVLLISSSRALFLMSLISSSKLSLLLIRISLSFLFYIERSWIENNVPFCSSLYSYSFLPNSWFFFRIQKLTAQHTTGLPFWIFQTRCYTVGLFIRNF